MWMSHWLIFVFLKNLYALLYFTCFKLTCGITTHFCLQRDTLLLRFWLGIDRSSLSWVCDKPGFSGSFCSEYLSIERGMASSYRIEIEKFNGKKFEIWKMKMEDLLVDKEQWIIVDPSTQPTGTPSTSTQAIGTQPTSTPPTSMSKEYWEKLDRRARSTIRLYLQIWCCWMSKENLWPRNYGISWGICINQIPW